MPADDDPDVLINRLQRAQATVTTAGARLRAARADRDQLIMRLHDQHGWGARRISNAAGGLTAHGVRNILDRETARRETPPASDTLDG